MKRVLAFLIFFVNAFSLSAQAPVPFKVQYSAPYATYDFLIKISDNYPDNDLKTIFLQSKYNTEAFKQQVSDFAKLSMDYTYSFNQYPLPLKAGLMSRDILEKNLATSETVAGFLTKSLGIIPNEDLSACARIIENFIPVYNELIFEPNKAAFELQQHNLLQYVNNNQFAAYFQIGLLFYNTQWDKNIPFELCLLPSLEKNNLGARAFINVAVCEASRDLKNHRALFSVAMHEIYHIIYDNQSLALKSQMQQWFDQTASPNSQYALLLLNEVLATALGNAYVMEQLAGKIEEDDWYDNYYISAMAKEIYPLVKQYIRDKKPMDEAFVKAYVQIYDSRFPQWNKALNHILAYRYIVADKEEDLRYFRRNYRKYAYNRMGAPITAADIEKLKALPVTKVFVIAENHRQTLDLIRRNFKELNGKKLNDHDEFIKVFDLADRTHLILINRHQATTEAMMNKYFPGQVMP